MTGLGHGQLRGVGASRLAVLGLTQALARDVAAHGIRVNAVCPGYVRTSMQER